MEEDKHKYEEQTEDLYAAIGRFAVEFEHICNYLRQITCVILAKEGLRNDNVMEILLVSLNAEPLRTLALSLIAATIRLSELDKEIVSKIMDAVQAMIKKRNQVIHATWFVGWLWNEEMENTVAPGLKIKRTKTGVTTERYEWTADDFNNLAKDAKRLGGLLARLNNCFVGNFKVQNNFAIDERGIVAATAGLCK